MHDIIVIGAGPIGCYTAYKLAKDGFDVLVLEKKDSFKHPPVCTGIIGVEAFKRFNLPSNSIISEIKDISLFSPSGLSLTFRPNSTQAFVVDRAKFDQGLRDLALRSGAVIRLGTYCKDIQIKDSYVEISTQGRTLKAKAIVIASGFSPRLTKGLGLGRAPHYIQGMQTEVKMDGVKETEVYLGNNIASGSFAWVVGLKDGWARIGLATKHNASFFLRRFLEGPILKNRIKEKGVSHAKPIPLGSLQRTFSKRVVVVGEAAGLVKTTTHGGIYYGLISSQFAVETLKEAFREGNFECEVLKRYEMMWRDKLSSEIKIGHMLRRFFSLLNDRQIDRFFKIAIKNGVMDLIYQNARFDWHADLILSLIRHSLFKKNKAHGIKL